MTRLLIRVAAILGTGALIAIAGLAACGTTDAGDNGADPGAATVAEGTPSEQLTPTAIPPGETPPVLSPEPTISPTSIPTPVPTVSVIPTPPPAPTEVIGISYAQPTEWPLISGEEAVAIARETSGAGVDLTTWPREQFTATYVLLTDLRLNWTNDLGTPEARNQPVWIVTVRGLHILPSGPAPIPGETPTPDPRVSTELNIVIDAMTGEWVESYTFK
jgi:hypothetical protein